MPLSRLAFPNFFWTAGWSRLPPIIKMLDMDTLTPVERSRRMGLVRSKDTKPELSARRLVHSLGYRYRLQGKLPGRPDMVFSSRRKVIFVHGCFWHRHQGCLNCRLPKSRLRPWRSELECRAPLRSELTSRNCSRPRTFRAYTVRQHACCALVEITSR